MAHINLGIALRDQGKLGRGDRRIPRGDPAQARPRRGPLQPRHRPATQGKLEEAIAECREAIRLKPDHAEAHYNLGTALSRPGEAGRGDRRIPRGDPAQARLRRGPLQPRHRPEQPGEAGRGDRRIPRGDPAQARLRRGPQQPRRYPDAPGEARRGDRRIPRGDPAPNPTTPQPTPTSATPCEARASLDEAVAEYREAIRLKPDDAAAHYNLGNALEAQGKLSTRPSPNTARRSGSSPTTPRPTATWAASAGSRALRRVARDVPPGARAGHRSGPTGATPRPQWVAEAERLAALANAAAGLAQGRGPAPGRRRTPGPRRLMCYDTNAMPPPPGSGPRRWQADPKLGDDRRAGHRYNAACAAALAGAGQGKDDPQPDDAAQAKLRGQALDWLKAERAAWAKLLDSGDAQARPVVRRRSSTGRPTPTWPASASRTPWRSSPRPSGSLAAALGRGRRPAGQGPGRPALSRPDCQPPRRRRGQTWFQVFRHTALVRPTALQGGGRQAPQARLDPGRGQRGQPQSLILRRRSLRSLLGRSTHRASDGSPPIPLNSQPLTGSASLDRVPDLTTACSMQSANPAFQRESSHHAFTGGIQKIGEPGASSIMAVPSLDSAGAALYGRRWEHEGVRTIANHSAQEFGAQLPCRPQYPRIRTDGKRTAHGVRVVYREQEARER